ncbi:helix-hairpin-helix domain-containing protein [Candidatus Oleimmundimicrobium sp.]|uniref:helix-hairpin-helix domain-containing protein n=1 Tax=Candidatus Oleimmundimicrobium sp. TaxID=3060597 RepID=UPI0027276D7B|nr:helix-hairpin-helix domain-containing protein [Candidatus Oleimmundimicrobium sp.]MDO8885858.1 helix-hairpin-helix domain-containing protein [Candidatus Oleimmundimicrobium sp.]
MEKIKEFIEKIFDEFYLSKGQVYAVGALVAFLILGSGTLYLRSKPVVQVKEVKEVEDLKGIEEERVEEVRKIYVYICGAVQNADVYLFEEGDRVKDAIAKAGGAVEDANLEALNLAAKLIDGQKIYVPKVGEDLPPEIFEASAVLGPVNINAATAKQLEELPGIGEVIAQRIVDYRIEHGGFKTIDELLEVEGIGAKKFESIKDRVVAN